MREGALNPVEKYNSVNNTETRQLDGNLKIIH